MIYPLGDRRCEECLGTGYNYKGMTYEYCPVCGGAGVVSPKTMDEGA